MDRTAGRDIMKQGYQEGRVVDSPDTGGGLTNIDKVGVLVAGESSMRGGR